MRADAKLPLGKYPAGGRPRTPAVPAKNSTKTGPSMRQDLRESQLEAEAYRVAGRGIQLGRDPTSLWPATVRHKLTAASFGHGMTAFD